MIALLNICMLNAQGNAFNYAKCRLEISIAFLNIFRSHVINPLCIRLGSWSNINAILAYLCKELTVCQNCVNKRLDEDVFKDVFFFSMILSIKCGYLVIFKE